MTATLECTCYGRNLCVPCLIAEFRAERATLELKMMAYALDRTYAALARRPLGGVDGGTRAPLSAPPSGLTLVESS